VNPVRSRKGALRLLLPLLIIAWYAYPAAAQAPTSLPGQLGLQGPALPIQNTATFTASVNPAGHTVQQVLFYYEPSGLPAGQIQSGWIAFPNTTTVGSGPGGQATYTDTLDTTGLSDGNYDIKAVAIDLANNPIAMQTLPDQTVTNTSAYIALQNPGSLLSGSKVTLSAQPLAQGNTPDHVTFLVCPTTQDCSGIPAANSGPWSPVGSWTFDPNDPSAPISANFDTSQLNGGAYDITVIGSDANGDPFQGGEISDVVVDNTTPTVSLQNPGTLSGANATLTATADDGNGAGIASVAFQLASAGSGNWQTVGTATAPVSANSNQYSFDLDTRQFTDGAYDIQAIATALDGEQTTSAIVSGVSVSNSAGAMFSGLTVTDINAPATNVTLLGELPGAAHETWALGQSTAPNAGHAVVVLEYTTGSGWQIVQTLRNPAGQPWVPTTGDTVQFEGAMAPDGEAWVAVEEGKPGTVGSAIPWSLFHRQPNGNFAYDSNATQSLTPLMVGTFSLKVAEPGGPSAPVYAALFPGKATATAGQPVWSQQGWANVPVSLNYAVYGPAASCPGGAPACWSTPPTQLPSSYVAPAGVTRLTLDTGDITGQNSGWMAIQVDAQGNVSNTILASFDSSGLSFHTTGLDALDSTGQFADDSQQSAQAGGGVQVTPTDLTALPGGGGFISATVSESGNAGGKLVAQFDQNGTVVNSWCSNGLLNAASLPQISFGCAQSLSTVPAVVPNSGFSTASAIGLASSPGSLSVFADGTWHLVPAQGFQSGGSAVFADATDGWITGANTLGMVSASAPPAPLASWPEATRNPLLSIALPPGNSTTNTTGALAVGLDGTALHYDPATGWQVDGTPVATHSLQLDGVAFASSSSAFAVGAGGTIVDWNGSQWSADPESTQLTRHTLNAVAFGSNGQGWAVGAQGTILHYDGTAWATETIDPADSGTNVTSVAVAAGQVFAIAGGNLIERTNAGGWARVPSTQLPTPTPASGSLQLVSGLADGGLVIAAKVSATSAAPVGGSLIIRNSSAASFQYAPVGLPGIPVALAAFRDGSGALGAFVSVAPALQSSTNTGGFPAGDGDLLKWSSSGLTDLSQDMPPNTVSNPGPDGVVHPDPVLAVAASPDGAHAWAAGGYSGTLSADGVGTPPGYSLIARQLWFSSSIWRYDAGGSVSSQATAPATINLPAKTGVVTFAFMSGGVCVAQCSAVQDAQPFVNLETAAGEIAGYAQQPGGPAFTMIGGNAVGSNASDIGTLPQLLAPLTGVPTYAVYGPLDAAQGLAANPNAPWAQVFAGGPAPFGGGPVPAGMTAGSAGDPSGAVNRYYAFDVSQNAGTLRVIVLDNSQGSLDASAPGQSGWLANELASAQAAAEPVVVFAAEPLDTAETGSATDGDAVAAQLAAAGVLAVFTTSGGASPGLPNFTQADQETQIPANPTDGGSQIPEYEGATMTYQQTGNSGVLWYDVTVNTQSGSVGVSGIPVVSSLALDPVDGLTAQRSSTLLFQAIGRRPASTIATSSSNPTFPGFDQYVSIPAPGCTTTAPGATCPPLSYSFTSSDPVVGNFVAPSSAGSNYPKLTAAGLTTPSSSSGLFCAFNQGTTTVTVTVGLMSTSLPVTVKPGGFGPPCGTVPGGLSSNIVTIQGATSYESAGQPNSLTQPKVNPATKANTPPITPPPPPPVKVVHNHPVIHQHHPAPAPKPNPVPVQQPQPQPFLNTASAAVAVGIGFAPVPPAPITPVPPGGATAPAQSTAKREEKARKHASQSAYVTRPAGEGGSDWFYAVAGGVTVVALLLIAGGVTPGPKRAPAYAQARITDDRRRRHG
jgi:hypothetical protein